MNGFNLTFQGFRITRMTGKKIRGKDRRRSLAHISREKRKSRIKKAVRFKFCLERFKR